MDWDLSTGDVSVQTREELVTGTKCLESSQGERRHLFESVEEDASRRWTGEECAQSLRGRSWPTVWYSQEDSEQREAEGGQKEECALSWRGEETSL